MRLLVQQLFNQCTATRGLAAETIHYRQLNKTASNPSKCSVSRESYTAYVPGSDGCAVAASRQLSAGPAPPVARPARDCRARSAAEWSHRRGNCGWACCCRSLDSAPRPLLRIAPWSARGTGCSRTLPMLPILPPYPELVLTNSSRRISCNYN